MSVFTTPLLLVPSLLFEGLVRVRNWAYDTSILKQALLPHPVISVGNLTVGGSGKTPLVIHLAKSVGSMGVTPVLLSRGYGRREKRLVLLPPSKTTDVSVSLVGDEPALVRRHIPEIWLGISKHRNKAGLQISRRQQRLLFILDDGFQHRCLRRELDLVLLDPSQPLLRNRLFPSGTLREPLSGLRRATVAVINGRSGQHDSDSLESAVRRINPDLPIFHCLQRIERLVSIEQWRAGISSHDAVVNPGAVYLVAAIGNPVRFQRDVEMLGVEIRGSRFFRDHTRLQPDDWAACSRAASAAGADALVITEKDAIKATGTKGVPIWVAVQSTHFVEQAELERRLRALIEEHN